ncbi:MAG: ACP S-malonyltransferase [Alphaproteobacteria bacterium]|nr:ACP S-malonyltransferase [Alphaproteobacteria bacterium]
MTRPLILLFPGQSSRDDAMFQRLDALSPGRGGAARGRVETRLGHAVGEFGSNREIQIAVHELNLAYLDLFLESGLPVTASAGLSLGEYAHLVSIGALSAEDSRDLVAQRGAAYDRGPSGCMAAVHPIGPAEAIDLCADICVLLDDPEALAVSNFNSPTQCVVAGRTDAVEVFLSAAESRFFAIGRIIESRICMHMRRFRPAATYFASALKSAMWRTPSQSYWPNVLAQPVAHADAKTFSDCLTRHVYQPVLWRQTLEAFHALHSDAVFVEVGPLQVLSRMMGRRWLPRATVFSLDAPQTDNPPFLERTLEAIHDAVAA